MVALTSLLVCRILAREEHDQKRLSTVTNENTYGSTRAIHVRHRKSLELIVLRLLYLAEDILNCMILYKMNNWISSACPQRLSRDWLF